MGFKHYVDKVFVERISAVTLAKEILKRCGNEGHHPYLNERNRATLNFLRVAITFVPDASNDGADLANASFILNQPGGEFVVQAGGGDWEFYFSEDCQGNITGKCTRQPLRRYLWDRFTSAVKCVGKVVFKAIAYTGVVAGFTALAPFAGPIVGTALICAAEALGEPTREVSSLTDS